MIKTIFCSTLIVLCLSSNSWADTQDDLNIDSGKIVPEIVSASGKNKIKDHLQTLSQNIENTETNISSTKKNIGVIESEIKELEELAKEHSNLKNRYLEFLSIANKETKKNEKAIEEIDTFEKKTSALPKVNSTPTQLAEIEAAKSEKIKREEWRKETDQRSLKIKELLAGVEKNLQSIEGRKTPLQEQLKNWNNRLNEYEGLLTKLNKKKETAERFIASQKQLNPTKQ